MRKKALIIGQYCLYWAPEKRQSIIFDLDVMTAPEAFKEALQQDDTLWLAYSCSATEPMSDEEIEWDEPYLEMNLNTVHRSQHEHSLEACGISDKNWGKNKDGSFVDCLYKNIHEVENTHCEIGIDLTLTDTNTQ